MERRVALSLTAAAALWAAAIVFAPFGHHHRSTAVLATVIHLTGSAVCHQRPERSFTLEGRGMPVCARCTGIYVSGAAGALAAWLVLPLVPRRTRSTLLLAAAPTLLTVLVEQLGLVNPGNLVRWLAALPIGAACGWVFVRMLRAESAGQLRYHHVIYGHQIDRR